jgi:GNAT superfamily N-acetyltransferase
MLGWAQENGARHAYLGVVELNSPARRLYDKLGFREAYRYWYRVPKP